MALTVVGVSHRTAPLDIRERLAFGSEDAVASAARSYRELADAREVVLLSTCNRTELYVVHGSADPVSAVLHGYSDRLQVPAADYCYVHRDAAAAAHLMRVASGMDSMILGEAQVHGQVRRAWEASREHSGRVLDRLFHHSLTAASRVRADTSLARGAASVSSAGVALARKIFGSLAGRRAMILGAGDTAELALECLVAEGVRASMVANRTFDRATRLAAQYGAVALRLDDMWSTLHEVDVLICSTAAPRAIVGPDQLKVASSTRGDRPLCILDLAVPRDVCADVRALDNVYLYDLDDLRAMVAGNLEQRREALPDAELIIAREVHHFWKWYAAQAAVPALTEFRAGMNTVRERELDRLMQQLAHLPDSDREAIAHFSRSLMNKFLHAPTTRVRHSASTGSADNALEALRLLFDPDYQSPALSSNDLEYADRGDNARGDR